MGRLMMSRVLSLMLLLVGAITADAADEQAPVQRLKVRVFYETLCADSMRFIRYQLYSAMIQNDWLPYTDLYFVPYGKVSSWTNPSNNMTYLYCQHDTAECEKNALHACLVEHNSVRDQLLMINCLMRGYASDVDECASVLGIDVSAAKECKATRTTVDILQKYGVETNALDITFIPSTEIDNVFDPWRQRAILYNFAKVFCRMYTEKYNVTLSKC